ncbi:MAG: hypothetical protein ACRBCL_02700 [Maritimibacter sp.]
MNFFEWRVARLTPVFCVLLSGCIGSPYLGELGALQDELEPLQEAGTRGEAALPVSGTAEYLGVMTISTFAGELGLSDRRILYGAMDVSADFSNGGAVTGGVQDVESLGGDAYEGALTITSGQMDAAANMTFLAEDDYSLLGDMSGTLTDSLGEAVVLDGTVTGRVWGEQAEILETFFDGTVVADGRHGLAFGEGALAAQ